MWKASSSFFHKVTGTQRTVQIKILGLFSQGSTTLSVNTSIQSLTNSEIFDTLPPELSQPFQAAFAGPVAVAPCY